MSVSSIVGGTISPFGNKKFVLGMVLIVFILGGIGIASGPAFHSLVSNPAYCVPTELEIRMHLPCGDPFTVLWKDESNSIGAYNTLLASYSGTDGTGQTDPSIKLSANSTHTAVALLKVPQDFSTIAAKQFIGSFTWTASSNCSGCTSVPNWGIYLTRNSTLPTQAGYDPFKDNSVALMIKVVWSPTPVYGTYLYVQKDSTVSFSGSDIAGCSSGGAPGGSCFIQEPGFNKNPSTEFLNPSFLLNFTGVSNNPNGCNASTGLGDGCSNLGTNPQTTAAGNSGSTQILSLFQFQSIQYYIGFYAIFGATAPNIFWSFNNGPQGENDYFAMTIPRAPVCTASTPCPFTPQAGPNIDTGGFFGPLVRVLISIGIYILNGIISFVGFILPAITTALNVIGKFFGMGNIGTQIASFFATVLDWVNNIFGTAFSTSANVATFVVSGITLLVTIGSSFFSNAASFLAALANLFTFLIPVGNLILLGTHFGFSAFLTLWLFVGTFSAFRSFDSWLEWWRTTEMMILKVFKFFYWLGDEVFKLLTRIRTIGPRPAGV